VEWAQTAVTALVGALIGLQTFWISRALDRVDASLVRLDARLAHIEGKVLRDHGERIARLEQRGGAA
jgi:hypothetical protein